METSGAFFVFPRVGAPSMRNISLLGALCSHRAVFRPQCAPRAWVKLARVNPYECARMRDQREGQRTSPATTVAVFPPTQTSASSMCISSEASRPISRPWLTR